MAYDESAKRKFQCTNCQETIEIPASSILDKRNPELNLAMEGWFVLFPPGDWLGPWDGHAFCSFDCLTSWVKTAGT